MPERRGRSPVMHDVARLAGVSHQTVSRVLNAHRGIRPETEARVRAAIAELGYRRNTSARALVTHSSRLVGVLTTVPDHPDTARALVGIERALRAAGRTLLFAGTAPEELAASAERLFGHALEGCVALVPGQEGELAAVKGPPPTVVVDAPPAHAALTVRADQRGGAYALTRHLLDLGHRTVHHVAGTAPGHAARTEGWRQALREAGAPEPEAVAGAETGTETESGTGAGSGPGTGHTAGLVLAARRAAGEEVTAVLAADDHIALGLLHAFTESGLRVPGQVSVAGFGDRPEAAHLCPALTTASADPAEVGEAAVRLLLAEPEEREGAGANPEQDRAVTALLLPVRLRVRRSTGPPPARRPR
ncbi:LacI family DNA-binding transcriptional regulator [Nocardiopsis metallicus]|uniref:DNA-binding LacI/PurR family transcriptional regulator n=1 Tax=Nocardiopsis metallicus TaxID=179819 RepID=A0A840VZI1_9ACTN|nr:LacI family DNA-binding transcriptional regulator [Nocardiopsis metallicus]MBB5489124.1 DNA-binding LacI/PurR family transcriptional regulator [Nocardiopsis metallicus]